MLYYYETNNGIVVQKNVDTNAHRDYMDNNYCELISI